ncbi:monofunctional biosynthetic peptidoglycan transglycosylase [Povalibacter uvarum]|uniref:Biosynthetic peptidoglycan transglycosylase n=1 Tax=Povalibacter uvarum TaxID=732238 RepID=A0A841HV81_9GAMM|nr:monofunctional biosynthetic peptidoglycan transglycosylase [Povalibacter uvarum]MBB6095872.1 monofunctional biosynthetic peptidoglycan transglycosylase [Povalibacter uvarum]
MRRISRIAGWLLLSWIVLTVSAVLLMRWIDPLTSAFMVRERIVASTSKPQYAVRQRWVDAKDISPQMKLAVIASEDQTFPDHYGFDFKSIDKALDERESGRRVRGASTISQQVAKNLFLWSGKSWIRKGLEAYFTVLIETLWPKERILEVYLNIAEFGKGVFGVGVASETYFKKPAVRLNTYDAALLAAVLPNPKRLRANAPSRYVRSRQEWIVGQMRGLGGTALLKRLD